MKTSFPTAKLKSSQPLLLTVATIAIVVGATFFFAKPTWGKYQANRKAYEQEKNDIEKLTQKLDSLNQFDDASLRNRLAEVQYALPDQKAVPSVIAGLSRLSNENNLRLEALQIRPGKLATESGQQEISFKVTMSGDFRNVDAFLKRLSEIRRVFGIQKLNSSSSFADGSFVTNLDLSIYMLPSVVELGNTYTDPLPDGVAQKFTFIDKLAQYPVYTDLSGNVQLPLPRNFEASPSAESTGSAVQGARTIRRTPVPLRTAAPQR